MSVPNGVSAEEIQKMLDILKKAKERMRKKNISRKIIGKIDPSKIMSIPFGTNAEEILKLLGELKANKNANLSAINAGITKDGEIPQNVLNIAGIMKDGEIPQNVIE